MIVRVYVRGTDNNTGNPTKYHIFTGYASHGAIATWQADGYIVEAADTRA